MKKRPAEFYTYGVVSNESAYVGRCVEFPELRYVAASPSEALEGITQLVENQLLMTDDPPEPLSRKKFSGKIAVRVTPDLHRRLVLQAAERGVSLNSLINSKLSWR